MMYAYHIICLLFLSLHRAAAAVVVGIDNSSSPVLNYYCVVGDVAAHVEHCAHNVRPAEFHSRLLAFAKFANRINETGWAELEVLTNEKRSPNGAYIPGDQIGFQPTAGIDLKITSAQIVKDLKMVAISGPTNEQQASFNWQRTLLPPQPHHSHPIEWNFRPVATHWEHHQQTFPYFKFDL